MNKDIEKSFKKTESKKISPKGKIEILKIRRIKTLAVLNQALKFPFRFVILSHIKTTLIGE